MYNATVLVIRGTFAVLTSLSIHSAVEICESLDSQKIVSFIQSVPATGKMLRNPAFIHDLSHGAQYRSCLCLSATSLVQQPINSAAPL